MSASDVVRASRDGDQFHYLWAARRILKLLLPGSNLIAVTIEGASPEEVKGGEKIDTAEQIIDLAEYYGSEEIKKADLVRYVQVKHSTYRSNDPWPPSGLRKTLKGFADRYLALRKEIGGVGIGERLQFCFVTNRPVNSSVIQTIEDAANAVASRHPKILKSSKSILNLTTLKCHSFSV